MPQVIHIDGLKVPPHVFGAPPEPRGRVERGEQELAEIRYFERSYPGTELQRSPDAQFVETRETLRNMGLA
jgi:hypothetical protein